MLHIEELLNGLSDLRVDLYNQESNSRLLQRVEEATDALATYIRDDSEERALADEFKEIHQTYCAKQEEKQKIEDEELEKLSKELQELQERNNRLQQEIRALKEDYEAKFAGQDTAANIQKAREMQESLRQWQRAKEQAMAEVQQWHYKLAQLEETLMLEKASQEKKDKMNKLLYEFISSSLNIAIVNIKEPHVDLALMSETKDRTDQTWHRLTVNMDECDQQTTDYLWDAIAKTFDCEPIEAPGNTAMETFRLGRQ